VSASTWYTNDGLRGVSELSTTGDAIVDVSRAWTTEAIALQPISRTELASRMHTTRAALTRLLDPEHEVATLSTLRTAA